MGRIDRHKRSIKELKLVKQGGLFDALDNEIKQIFRIDDEQFDYLCEKATDDELALITEEKLTFTQKRELITILNKYVP